MHLESSKEVILMFLTCPPASQMEAQVFVPETAASKSQKKKKFGDVSAQRSKCKLIKC